MLLLSFSKRARLNFFFFKSFSKCEDDDERVFPAGRFGFRVFEFFGGFLNFLALLCVSVCWKKQRSKYAGATLLHDLFSSRSLCFFILCD